MVEILIDQAIDRLLDIGGGSATIASPASSTSVTSILTVAMRMSPLFS
ncbi:hypothetical protein [Rhizobium sp. G21]|nr:hypothetical protein [Rhizobium sp. G21]